MNFCILNLSQMGLSDVFFSNLPQHFIAWRKCSQSVKHKQVEKKNIKTPRMQIFIIFFLISIPCLKNRTCCLCLLHLCKGLAPLSLFLQAADIWGNCAGYSSAQGEYDRVPGLPCDTHPDFQKLALALPCSRKLGCGLSLMLPLGVRNIGQASKKMVVPQALEWFFSTS